MTFVKHATCDTDVIIKRVKPSTEDHALIKIWCPTCERTVKREELTNRGPYSAYLEEGSCVSFDGS